MVRLGENSKLCVILCILHDLEYHSAEWYPMEIQVRTAIIVGRDLYHYILTNALTIQWLWPAG